MYEEDINMMDIEEEDLSTEQEAFKAAMQKHTTIPKVETIQIENTSPWRTYHSHYLKQQITQCEANFLGDYIHNKVWKTMKPQLPLIAEYNLEPSKEKRKNKYIHNWCGPDAQCWCKNILYRSKKDMDLEKAAKFNGWCHDTNDWPIEETIPASERWPELVTESETSMWNLPNPYTWKTSMNEPELLSAIVP
ncbi:12335_t:CDS:2, partial [Gigaspora margarita]